MLRDKVDIPLDQATIQSLQRFRRTTETSSTLLQQRGRSEFAFDEQFERNVILAQNSLKFIDQVQQMARNDSPAFRKQLLDDYLALTISALKPNIEEAAAEHINAYHNATMRIKQSKIS